MFAVLVGDRGERLTEVGESLRDGRVQREESEFGFALNIGGCRRVRFEGDRAG
jgi:hypothetical protein